MTTDKTIEVQQAAGDVAMLAVISALDLIESAMVEAANKRNWRVLSLMMSTRYSLTDIQERLQEESK